MTPVSYADCERHDSGGDSALRGDPYGLWQSILADIKCHMPHAGA